ncbi:hypothetical protein BKA67DRAFT_529642 [Truncatella angustata]|uniref:Uncharacterized protein n=1 Tax=Truncatella angustata TaxID=152316 RepID=A0A9P9A1G2_9PEZI|nr:uncharacterized protein BKA67DRAFT_529642 [Truncatella angustata]KAH6659491.1 hypothetical protein BKA67DRAFT_529642 [Truncatella angustata]KAH8196517.1 hypothetical protein TruAng_009313 [Truncatella angustata]
MAPLISSRTSARTLATAELDSRSAPFRSLPRPSRSPPSLSFRRSIATAPHLVSRLNDNANIVPETYGLASNGPDAGTVVGIVLGSVGGFLLVLWLIYTIANLGNGNQRVIETATVDTASVITRKSRRHRRHSGSRRTASTRPRETVETIRRERVVPVSMPMSQSERIVVEETTRSRAPASAPPPPMPPPMPPAPPRVVHDDDDEVVVIEENSPPRRRESRQHKRRSSRRSSERRSTSRPGGYREVDPYRYAGGDASVRSVSRRRSPSRGGY